MGSSAACMYGVRFGFDTAISELLRANNAKVAQEVQNTTLGIIQLAKRSHFG